MHLHPHEAWVNSVGVAMHLRHAEQYRAGGVSPAGPRQRSPGECMSEEFTPHPLRGRVLGEVHARPFNPVETPRRILHFAFMTDEEAAARDRGALAALCESLGVPAPSAGAKHHRAVFSGSVLRWESHSEFTTYTWEFDEACEGKDAANGGEDAKAPFRPSPAASPASCASCPSRARSW